MSKRKPYESLHLLPIVIADAVATTVYDGCELSERISDGETVKRTEMLRSQMTAEQRREFEQLVDALCRAAYENKADYFMRIVRAKGNSGRDQLYMYVRHWLASYLHNPEILRRG